MLLGMHCQADTSDQRMLKAEEAEYGICLQLVSFRCFPGTFRRFAILVPTEISEEHVARS